MLAADSIIAARMLENIHHAAPYEQPDQNQSRNIDSIIQNKVGGQKPNDLIERYRMMSLLESSSTFENVKYANERNAATERYLVQELYQEAQHNGGESSEERKKSMRIGAIGRAKLLMRGTRVHPLTHRRNGSRAEMQVQRIRVQADKMSEEVDELLQKPNGTEANRDFDQRYPTDLLRKHAPRFQDFIGSFLSEKIRNEGVLGTQTVLGRFEQYVAPRDFSAEAFSRRAIAVAERELTKRRREAQLAVDYGQADLEVRYRLAQGHEMTDETVRIIARRSQAEIALIALERSQIGEIRLRRPPAPQLTDI